MTAKRALLTACTADYTTGTLGLMRSVAAAHPEVARYCYAPPDQVGQVAHALGDLATVLPIPRPVRGAPPSLAVQTSLSRVYAGSIPADAVVWMDSDVVVCGRADELWDASPGKVRAVEDQGYRIGQMLPKALWGWYSARFALTADSVGFNSGVLGIRPADWIDLPERFEEALATCDRSRLLFTSDQPILNGLMASRVEWLPRKFNAHGLHELGVPRDARVVHFTASPKPWSPAFRRSEVAYYYWLRYGVREPSRLKLGLAWGRVAAHRPARLAYKVARKLLVTAGVKFDPKGVD